MSFYIDGHMIGLTISSWYEGFLLFYIIIDIVFLLSTKMFLTHKLLILPYLIYQLRKKTPSYWSFKYLPWCFAMCRISLFKYKVFIEFNSKLPLKADHSIDKIFISKNGFAQTNEEFTLNWFGKIESPDISNKFNRFDEKLDGLVSYNREKKLKDLL